MKSTKKIVLVWGFVLMALAQCKAESQTDGDLLDSGFGVSDEQQDDLEDTRENEMDADLRDTEEPNPPKVDASPQDSDARDFSRWEKSGDNYFVRAGDVRFEVNPSMGGRITSFSVNGKEALRTAGDLAGLTFWSSPQSEWGWPPPESWDCLPFIASLNTTGDELTLVGQIDPQTGYQFEKRFLGVSDTSAVEITYSIRNTAGHPKMVAPWEITRVPPGGLSFFPAGDPAFEGNSSLLPSLVEDGIAWFWHRGEDNKKLFMDGREHWLAHKHGELLFVKIYHSDITPEQFAPNEAEIELYAVPDYVELEEQGAYVSLAAGDVMSWSVTWLLRELPTPLSDEGQGSTLLTDFVRSMR